MKDTMKKSIVRFMAFSLFVHALVLDAGYFDRLTPASDSWLGRTIAPFQAGHQYSEKEKDEARKAIVLLEIRKQNVMMKLLVAPYSVVWQAELKDIEDQLYKQKLITGDAWSTRRKIVLGSLALAGVAALGYGIYTYGYVSPQEKINRLSKQYAEAKWGKNPLFDQKRVDQLEIALKEAAKKIPYHRPAQVSQDDVVQLRNRLDEINKQRYIHNTFIENPNFDIKDQALTLKQYRDALINPKGVEGLKDQLTLMQKGNTPMPYSEREKIKGIVRDWQQTPYTTPAPVEDPYNIEQLKARLDQIGARRGFKIDYNTYETSWDKRREIERDYENAFKQYAKAYAETVPYHSPDLVTDYDDVFAFKRREYAIGKQKHVEVGDDLVKNPHFNQADYRAAQKDTNVAIAKEGIGYVDTFRFNPKEQFKIEHQLGRYKNAQKTFLLNPEDFDKIPEEKKVKLLSQAYPYKTPPALELTGDLGTDIYMADDRLSAIKKQATIRYGDKEYKNLSFNEQDYNQAAMDYDDLVREQERLKNQSWKDWVAEKVMGK